jgi:Secretion system C-terminal sorting domain
MAKRLPTFILLFLVSGIKLSAQFFPYPQPNGEVSDLEMIDFKFDPRAEKVFFWNEKNANWGTPVRNDVVEYSSDCSKILKKTTYRIQNNSNASLDTSQKIITTFTYADNRISKFYTEDNFGQFSEYKYFFNSIGKVDSIRYRGISFGYVEGTIICKYNEDKKIASYKNVNNVNTTNYEFYYNEKKQLRRFVGKLTTNGQTEIIEDTRFTYNALNQVSEMVEKNIYQLFEKSDSLRTIYSYNNKKLRFKEELFSINKNITKPVEVTTYENFNEKGQYGILTSIRNDSVSFGALRTLYKFSVTNPEFATEVTQQSRKANEPNFTNNSRFNYTNCQIVLDNIDRVGNLNISLYPNPTAGSLNLDILGIGSRLVDIQVFDISGKLLMNKPQQSIENPISISDLNNGFYILKIESNGKVGTKSFYVLK